MKYFKNLGECLTLPLIIILILSSCKNATQDHPLTALEAQGKAVYMSTCIACHNPNPKLPGSVGPDIAFSSLELIRARVTKAQYPEGYKPKRSSHIMPAFPQYEKDVEAIHAYLNSFSK